MFAIDDPTAVAVLPTPEVPGTPGFFTEGNPALGQAATYVRASWLNAFQQELLNVLAGAGIAPSKTAYDQLLTGLRSNALVYGSATGAPNTYAVSYAPAITALVDGMVLWFKASAANTGASTLAINGVVAKPIVGGAHAALQGGEIIANGKCMVIWNATLNSFVLIECTGAALQVAAATQSAHAMQLGQATGRVLAIRVLSGAGAQTYVPTVGMRFVDVLQIGAGGGGGGASSSGGGQGSVGGGGGSGAMSRGQFTAAQVGASLTVTNGAAGAGSVGSNVAGNSGGASSFGSLMTSPGGGGGPGCGVYTISGGIVNTGGAAGAAGTGGNIFNAAGNAGRIGIATTAGGISGGGADSPFGGGGGGAAYNTGGGSAAVGSYGAGGGGGAVSGVAANQPGGYGANGVHIVVEYA